MGTEIRSGKIISFDLFDKSGRNSLEQNLTRAGFERTELSDKDPRVLFKLRDRGTLFEDMVKLCGSLWGTDTKLLNECLDEISLRILPDDRKYALLPFATVAIIADVRKDILIHDDFETKIWYVANALGTFLSRLGGLSKEAIHSISSPSLFELRILMDQEGFKKMNDYAEKLYKLPDRSLESISVASKKLRSAEPISFSRINSELDYHSIIIGLGNLSFNIGCMAQPGFGGLYHPYLLAITNDENTVGNLFNASNPMVGAGIRDYFDLYVLGSQCLILPLLTNVWLEYLRIAMDKTDLSLGALKKRMENDPDASNQILEGMSQMGLELSVTIETLEFIGRCQKDGLIIGTSRHDEGFNNKFMKKLWINNTLRKIVKIN